MFNNNPDFFPTPATLIAKMLDKIDFKYISSILENSAGKGDLADAIIEKFKLSRSHYYNREAVWDIDTVELNSELRMILKGKGYRVVHDDYLTYNTYKHYDAIISNPPFSIGDKFLLKMIEMQEYQGGVIVSLLGAETLRNPYSNTRKELLDKLEHYNAEIEYIQNAFIDSERSTNVEVALIYISIPKPEHSSIILDDLMKQEQFREEVHYNNEIVNADFLKGIVQKYNFEVKTGLRLIAEFNAMKPYILSSFKDDSSNTILNLTVTDKDQNSSIENAYIKNVRSKYWLALFTNEDFMGLFTSNLREKYQSKINELKNYDFSLYNIYTIKIQLNNEMIKGVEDTMLKLFDEFSYQSSWDKEFSKNIHYYNGWKTNSCWKVNPRIIIRLNGFNTYDGSIEYDYKVKNKLGDIQKTFDYLDNGLTDDVNIKDTLESARGYGNTKKIKLKHFTVTFYKKGTCHIEFSNLDLLGKFNILGSQRHNWLPPSYGKKNYNDMTQEEKTVVDEFEGKDSYDKVMSNKEYFIVETSKLLMLT